MSALTAIKNMHAGRRLLICLALALLCFIGMISLRIDHLTRVMISWDAFSLCFIILSWIVFFYMKPDEIRLKVKGQDTSRSLTFIIVLGAALTSLLGVLILLGNKEHMEHKNLVTGVYILGVTFSWILVHTIFTIRYAHLYYGDDADTPGTHAGGLIIPDETKPDYIDFAYFSFIIGMTFQVSDISINSRVMRRLVLLHSIISFVFNTVIVALTINVILELKQ